MQPHHHMAIKESKSQEQSNAALRTTPTADKSNRINASSLKGIPQHNEKRRMNRMEQQSLTALP